MELPPFHTLGLSIQVITTLYGTISAGVYPPTVLSKESLPMMPTPSNILQHMVRTRSNAIVTIPAMLQVWAESKESVDLLKSLEFVVSTLQRTFFHKFTDIFLGVFGRTRCTKARGFHGRIRCQTSPNLWRNRIWYPIFTTR